MDLNIVILSGRLAADPELRLGDSGARSARFLVITRVEAPHKRLDIVPVVLWDPPERLLRSLPRRGDGVWVAASLQRRFWDQDRGRRSRLEVVAYTVEKRPEPGSADGTVAALAMGS